MKKKEKKSTQMLFRGVLLEWWAEKQGVVVFLKNVELKKEASSDGDILVYLIQ